MASLGWAANYLLICFCLRQNGRRAVEVLCGAILCARKNRKILSFTLTPLFLSWLLFYIDCLIWFFVSTILIVDVYRLWMLWLELWILIWDLMNRFVLLRRFRQKIYCFGKIFTILRILTEAWERFTVRWEERMIHVVFWRHHVDQSEPIAIIMGK